MNGITLKQLKKIVDKGVKDGFGDKVVILSDDDEGNGYHTLFFGLTTNPDEIKDLLDWTYLHDNQNPNDIVILG